MLQFLLLSDKSKQQSCLGMWRSLHLNMTMFELRMVLANSKFVEFFYVLSSHSNLRSIWSAWHVYTHWPPVNLTFSERLKVIVFVGCVNKSEFSNLGFSQHSFHYGKNVLMMWITFLHLTWYTVQYMSKLLMYNHIHIHIRTDLCYEIHIRRLRIFLGFVTSLVMSH